MKLPAIYSINTADTGYLDTWASMIDVQHVRWTNMKDKTEFAFELIAPLKAELKQDCYETMKSKYIIYVAIVMKDSECPLMIKGDTILLELPFLTFMYALRSVPTSMKRQLDPPYLKGDNIYIEFERYHFQKMNIKVIERRKIQDEHKKLVDEYYNKIKGDEKYNGNS